MTTCLGKSCSFGLPYVSFVNVYHFFPFGFEGEIRDLNILIYLRILFPDHYIFLCPKLLRS